MVNLFLWHDELLFMHSTTKKYNLIRLILLKNVGASLPKFDKSKLFQPKLLHLHPQPWASRIFPGGATSAFCFSGFWRCNANGFSIFTKRLIFLLHKESAPFYGNIQKKHFVGSNSQVQHIAIIYTISLSADFQSRALLQRSIATIFNETTNYDFSTQEEILVSTKIKFGISLVLKKSCLRKLAISPKELLYSLAAIRL